MIKKGIFGMDDYIKFGKMIDCAAENGAVNFIFSPRKNMVIILCRRDSAEKIKEECLYGNVVSVITRGGMSWIKVVIG